MAEAKRCQMCAMELPAAIAMMGVCVRCVARADAPGLTIPRARYASDDGADDA